MRYSLKRGKKKKKEIWESSLKAWESKKVKEVENHEQEQNKAKNERATQIMSILKREKNDYACCFLPLSLQQSVYNIWSWLESQSVYDT